MNRDAGDPVIGDLVLARSDHRGTGGLPIWFMDWWLESIPILHDVSSCRVWLYSGISPASVKRSFLRRPTTKETFSERGGQCGLISLFHKMVLPIFMGKYPILGQNQLKAGSCPTYPREESWSISLAQLHTMELLHRRTEGLTGGFR